MDFTLEELALATGLMDLGLKGAGIQFYQNAANPPLLQSLLGKLQACADEASKSKTEFVEPPKDET